MRIAFDARLLDGPPSGVQDIARGLFAGLRTRPDITLIPVGTKDSSAPGAIRIPSRSFMTVGLPLAALRARAQRILIPRQTIPPLSPVRAVPFFHDIGFIERPDLYPDQERITRTTKIAARASTSLAVSPFTSEALQERNLTDRAVPLPIGALHEIAWSPSEGRPYLLCVAAQEPHKNLARLVEAWGERDRGADLVICGRPGRGTPDLMAALAMAKDHSSVRIASDLDDAAYADLLAGCWAYIQPSLYEGLCIPAMDLAAAGAPVAVADAANLGRVFAGTSVLFNPMDVTEMSQVIDRLLHDQAFRAMTADIGRERVRLTDWNEVARRAVEAMR